MSNLLDANEIKKHYLNTLNEALSSFNNLLNIEYRIKVARKDNIMDIKLVFLKRNFVHLAGLEKLTDIRISRAYRDLYTQLTRQETLSEYIKGQLAESKYFQSIVNRLYAIIDLRDNFYNAKDNKHYKFVCKEYGNYTLIDYDFFIRSEYENDIYYYFLRRDTSTNEQNRYVLVSLFIENEKDYTRSQSYMNLLEKIEIDRKSRKETIIYKRNS